MQLTNTLVTKKVAAVSIAVFLAFGLLFSAAAPTANAQLTESQIQSIIGLLQSFGADQTTINNVDASLRGETPTGGSGSGSVSTGFTFTQNLSQGDSGNEVMELQKFLNADPATRIASSGVGSPGNETDYFGSLTKAAVVKFQNKYTADVLAPVGLNAGTGYWGASSRAHANTLLAAGTGSTGGDTGSTGGDTGSTSGGGLTIGTTSQPSDSLAPDNASRVPFTKFRISAGSTDVTFKSVTVERVGLGSNTAFSSIMLVNQNGIILGDTKTLNSNNQARIGEAYTVKAGTSEVFTVAGNMPADNSARDGEQLSLNVVAVETSETVSGSFPIRGATHTVNASLAIGTASMARGALDPNVNTTKEAGTTGYTFQAVKLTAGSAEDVYIRSIRWDQTGSAGASDVENIVVVVDGTEYPTMLGADGDKYSTVFPGNGLLVEEGLNKEISIKGDVVSGADRTIIFDIEKATDIHVVGKTFGYGITPTQSENGTASDTATQLTSGTPFFDGAKVTVSAGALTISSSNEVPAGNIANGADDVALGAFKFDVRGEAISWSSIKFAIATTAAAGKAEITNISLTDANGNVLAGPEDPAANAASVTLSDSVTLNDGEHILIVRGNLDNNWIDGETIQISLTPNSTNIVSLKGETTGQTVTPTPSSAVSAKTQTVSAGALSVTPSGSLVSQTIVGNSTQVTLGRYVFDATNSGEDVRVSVAKFEATTGANLDIDDLNTLTLYKDGVELNSGSNVVNPSGNSPGDSPQVTFTLDGTGLQIAKGTSVIVDLKGNVSTSTGTSASTIRFDFSGMTDGDWTVTGVDTGTELTEDLDTATAGATITVNSAGTLTASLDSSDPVERWYIPGEEAEVAVIDLTSTNEDIRLTDLGLTRRVASSSAASIAELSLWDGATKLLTKTTPAFNGADAGEIFANVDSSFSFDVPGDDDNDLTVKVKFAAIGTNKPGKSGEVVSIGTTTDKSKNKARGLDSGTSINILGSLGTSTGARVFKALPELTPVLTNVGTNLSNAQQELYRFSVTAKGDDVGLYKFSFNIATSGVTTTGFKVTEVNTGKLLRTSQDDVDSNGDLDVVVATGSYGSAVVTVPAGQTRTFKLEGTTTGAADGDSITVKLLGDTNFVSATVAAPAAGGVDTLYTAANVDTATDNNFIWSPLSTTTAVATNDWANGFRVPGIEFDDLASHTRSQ